MLTLKKALADFGRKLFRKGNTQATIAGYLQGAEMIYKLCGKVENRKEVKAKEIENVIFSRKDRSIWTKAYYAVRIRAFLKFCRSIDIKVINPEQVIIPKTRIKEAKYLNNEEEKKVMYNLQFEDFLLKVWIMLMIGTGLRISEACNLSKEDLNKTKIVGGFYQIPIQWKGGETRAIFLSEELYILCKQRARRHNKKTILGITNRELARKIQVFSEDIGIKFTAHTLRHTYLTKLAESWVELYKIQKLAGHKCIITTSRYLHTCDLELANAVWKLYKVSY